MKKILTNNIVSPVGFPLTRSGLELIQDAYTIPFNVIGKSNINGDTNAYAVNNFSFSGDNIINYAGELFYLPEHSFDPDVNFLCLYKDEFFDESIRFSDGIERDVLRTQNMVVNIGTLTGTTGLIEESGHTYTKICNLEDLQVKDDFENRADDKVGCKLTDYNSSVYSADYLKTFTSGEKTTFKELKAYRVDFNQVRLVGDIIVTGSTLGGGVLAKIPQRNTYWNFNFVPKESLAFAAFSINNSGNVTSKKLFIYGQGTQEILNEKGQIIIAEPSGFPSSNEVVHIDVTYYV